MDQEMKWSEKSQVLPRQKDYRVEILNVKMSRMMSELENERSSRPTKYNIWNMDSRTIYTLLYSKCPLSPLILSYSYTSSQIKLSSVKNFVTFSNKTWRFIRNNSRRGWLLVFWEKCVNLRVLPINVLHPIVRGRTFFPCLVHLCRVERRELSTTVLLLIYFLNFSSLLYL